MISEKKIQFFLTYYKIKSNFILGMKIYDITLRDGLQSLKPYSLEDKIKCVNEIFKNNNYYVEYGTITKENSTSQMHNSDKILEYIKQNFPNTQTIYGILIPNINFLSYEIIGKNNAFSLLCTVDEEYSYVNFKKTSHENFNDILEMLQTIIRYCYNLKKIRIYIACSFNKLQNNNDKLYNYTYTIINVIKKYKINSDIIDIVFADTYNDITPEILFNTLSLFTSEKKKYIGLHLHCGYNFKELIDVCLKMKINKIDSGLCNIGSCNFVKNKETTYISTIKLIEYLNSKNIELNNKIDIEILKTTENKLIDILKL